MNISIITAKDIQYIYTSGYSADHETVALSDINITIERGQFVAVLGRNGSGKSTFARLMNALLEPAEGIITINGMDTRDEENLWEIRRTVGMIFQNPDNQIVATTVEEDVAFGPENLGIPPDIIRKRVTEAMDIVGIGELCDHAPYLLSGGQKQRVAIAGILAMKPQCIVLDEATSMLDPVGRREVMSVMRKLNKEENITVLHITHNMDEARMADRVIVMDNGRVALDGTPNEVFSNVDKVKDMGLDVPQVTELFYNLSQEGLKLPTGILDIDNAVVELKKVIG